VRFSDPDRCRGDPAFGAPRHRPRDHFGAGDRFEFVRITDEQAIVIQGDQLTIRPSPRPAITQ
jgi:hypothetical protein